MRRRRDHAQLSDEELATAWDRHTAEAVALGLDRQAAAAYLREALAQYPASPVDFITARRNLRRYGPTPPPGNRR